MLLYIFENDLQHMYGKALIVLLFIALITSSASFYYSCCWKSSNDVVFGICIDLTVFVATVDISGDGLSLNIQMSHSYEAILITDLRTRSEMIF